MKVIDLTGQKFDMLTVIKRDDNIGKRTQWVCKCDCGNVVTVKTETLKGKAKIKSCGCIYGKKDLTGMKFGKLTVIRKYGSKNNKIYWECICDCGNKTVISTDRLKGGHTKSCGCVRKENCTQKRFIHGKSKTRIYEIWCGIKERCCNKKSKSFSNYGGRGIKICDEWKSFEGFYKWAIKSGYSDTLTIERINFNGDYCPGNCTWIEKSEQAKNTRRNVFIEILGEKKILEDWKKFMGWKSNKFSVRKARGKEIFTENEIKQIKEKLRSDYYGKL